MSNRKSNPTSKPFFVRMALPATYCLVVALFLIIANPYAAADRRSEKKENEKSKEAIIDAIEQLEQRIDQLNNRIKELEKQLNDKTNPLGKMNERDKRIALKLAEPLPINFEANKLVNVLDYFRNTTGCNVWIDWTRLDGAGIEQEQPITMQLNDVSAAHALKLVLIQASPKRGDHTAVFKIHDGVVYVTTKNEMKQIVD